MPLGKTVRGVGDRARVLPDLGIKKKNVLESSSLPADVARKLAHAAQISATEEDLRIRVEHVLREALPELPEPKYEKAIKTSTFTGRADAVHQGLVIEYEKPGSFRHAAKQDEAVGQVFDYLTGLTLGAQAQVQKTTRPSLFPAEVAYTQEQEDALP